MAYFSALALRQKNFHVFCINKAEKKYKFNLQFLPVLVYCFLKYTMDWLNLKLILEYISRKGIYEN